MVSFDPGDKKRIADDPATLQLDACRIRAVEIAEALQKKFGWTNIDWRVATVHRVKNIIQSVSAYFIFHRAIFPTNTYWLSFYDSPPTEALFKDFNLEADIFLRASALAFVFSAIESDFRLVVTRLDSKACGGGTGTFDSISKWLFGRIPSLAKYGELLDLYRLARNTIHNNGVYNPTNGKNAVVKWAGRTFEFSVGKPIDFVNWSFICWLFLEVLSMLETVLSDPAIVELPAA